MVKRCFPNGCFPTLLPPPPLGRDQAWNLHRDRDQKSTSGLRSFPSVFQDSPPRTPVFPFWALNSNFFSDNWVKLTTPNSSSLETHNYRSPHWVWLCQIPDTINTNVYWASLRNTTFYFHFFADIHIWEWQKGLTTTTSQVFHRVPSVTVVALGFSSKTLGKVS